MVHLTHALLVFENWKLDVSQWKVDTNHPKLVEGSIGIYHWEIYGLDMVKAATLKNEGEIFEKNLKNGILFDQWSEPPTDSDSVKCCVLFQLPW